MEQQVGLSMLSYRSIIILCTFNTSDTHMPGNGVSIDLEAERHETHYFVLSNCKRTTRKQVREFL